MLEILDRERAAERQDDGVPEHAEHQQVPVRPAEAQQVGRREARVNGRWRRSSRHGTSRSMPPVEDRSHQADRCDRRRDDQRRLPARGVCVGEPCRRHVGRKRSRPPDGEREAHREGDPAARELLDDRGGHGDVLGLGADAEQQPARRPSSRSPARSRQCGAGQADRGAPERIRAAPKRSTSTPPIRISTMFGRL